MYHLTYWVEYGGAVQYFCWKQRCLSTVFWHIEFQFGARQTVWEEKAKFFWYLVWHTEVHHCCRAGREVKGERLHADLLFMSPFFSRLSRWSRGLRCRSATVRLLGLWFQIPPWAWKFVCCKCCVSSGRGFCVRLITLPEESYSCVCVCVSWSVVGGNITSTPTMSR